MQAIFRAQAGEEAMLGTDDFLPEGMAVLRRAGRFSPQALAELAGTGLYLWSGTVA